MKKLGRMMAKVLKRGKGGKDAAGQKEASGKVDKQPPPPKDGS